MNNPAPFPEVITRLKNLKRFDFRENRIKEMPQSILAVQSLEAFLWTGGTTNVPTFPDFTQFKNLKKLVISKKFHSWKDRIFIMPHLEHLEIDRNKEAKEFFTQDILDSWIKMAATKDEQFQKRIQAIIDNKQVEADGRFSYMITPAMKPEDLQAIDRLPKLKYLNLSFNDLANLPEAFFQLKNLEYLDLRSNQFPKELEEKIIQAFPNAEIVW